MSDEILAKVTPSAVRRLFALGALWALGGLLIYIALVQPPAFGWQAFLILFGALILWCAEQMRRSTALELHLTETELRDSAGRILIRLDQIKKVERGVFAFKPSNGFLIIAKEKAPRAWAPGLWWRLGRHIGVGGVTAASQTKSMAEIIAFQLAKSS